MSNIEENNKENEESQITDEQLDDQDDILGDSDRYTCTYEKVFSKYIYYLYNYVYKP